MRLPPGRRAFIATALSKFHFSNSPPPTYVAHLWSIAFLAECDRSTFASLPRDSLSSNTSAVSIISHFTSHARNMYHSSFPYFSLSTFTFATLMIIDGELHPALFFIL